MVGGTGSGKTWLAPRWVYRKLVVPNTVGIAVGTGYKRHVANLMVPMLSEFLDSIDCKWTFVEDKGRFYLPRYNSQIIFGSSENPNAWEGKHVDFGWMDEAGLMSRLAWDVLRRRTGANAGQILITTVPYFQGWLKTDLYDPWERGTDEGLVEWVKCASGDNPDYSKAELEYQRKNMRPDKFAIYYLGEWAKPAGLVFPTEVTEDCTFDMATEFAWNTCECCAGTIPHDWPAYSGHDWGWNAPTTGAWGRLSPDDVLYIVADYQQAGLTIEDHILEWKMAGLSVVDEAFGDPANPEQWERAAVAGYSVEAADNSISAGIDTIYNRLQTGRLRVSKNCNNILDGFDRYVWDEDKNDENSFLDKPKKPQEAEHIMDALRYLCISLQNIVMPATRTMVDSRSKSMVP